MAPETPDETLESRRIRRVGSGLLVGFAGAVLIHPWAAVPVFIWTGWKAWQEWR